MAVFSHVRFLKKNDNFMQNFMRWKQIISKTKTESGFGEFFITIKKTTEFSLQKDCPGWVGP